MTSFGGILVLAGAAVLLSLGCGESDGGGSGDGTEPDSESRSDERTTSLSWEFVENRFIGIEIIEPGGTGVQRELSKIAPIPPTVADSRRER